MRSSRPAGGSVAAHFEPAFFDLVWTRHSRMNMPKAGLLATTTEWLDAAATSGAPPFGVPLLLGEGCRPAFEGLGRNLREDRLRVVEGLLERPS